MEREIEQAENALASALAPRNQLGRRGGRVHRRRDVREVRALARRGLPALDVRVQVREDEADLPIRLRGHGRVARGLRLAVAARRGGIGAELLVQGLLDEGRGAAGAGAEVDVRVRCD